MVPPPEDIARLEQARLARAIAAVAPVAEPIAGGMMCRGEPGSWMNKAAGLGLSGPVSAADIERLVRFYSDAGIEPRVEICPFVHESLVKELAGAGFTLRRMASVLVRSAADGTDAVRDVPAGLTIAAVDVEDAEALREFARTAHRGFLPAGAEPTETETGVWIQVARAQDAVPVLARLEGQPASAGFLDIRPPHATLYAASVLPEFRRRGVQTAMIAARARLAADRGAQFVTITSDPLGPTERNARRLGFQSAYTHLILAKAGPGLAPNR